MSTDSYYTPPELAKNLLNYIDNSYNPKTVIDFCVGDGILLKAAVSKWPKIKCYGTDISEKAIVLLKDSHSDWILDKCDFLNANSRATCAALKNKINGFDLILINPPFSCIGGTKHKVELKGEIFDVSTSMAFLVESIKYLKNNGCIYAILPSSVAYSEKDNKLWNVLVEKYHMYVLEEPNVNHFKDCSPNIIIISINEKSNYIRPIKIKQLPIHIKGISIFRGKISMHTIDIKSNEGFSLIHSTNLRNNRVENLKYKVKRTIAEINGPAVLIPRVGNPNIEKICTILQKTTFILSDCVIAIKTQTVKDTLDLKNMLIKNWNDMKDLYKGTGAKYITVNRLKKYLGLKK